MMQTRLLLPLLILALVTPSAQAQRRNATLIINGGTLIDGTGAPPVPDAAVVVSGNRIAEAGPSSKIKVSKNTKTIDARGKWIIPGLIDAHVHFFQSSDLYTRPDIIDLRQRHMDGSWSGFAGAYRIRSRVIFAVVLRPL
jgi:hypothetical protein